MTGNYDSLILYDSDITDLLNGWPCDIQPPRTEPEHLGSFEDLQEPELISMIYRRSYKGAYNRLKKLSAPLPPKDAMAACLCALAGTERLMNEVLDHCPPIPAFQFQGVGSTASLLTVAARHDKHKMLDILLRRGADPNRGTDLLTTVSPLEAAFTASAFQSLKRLLEEPDLKLVMTEEMLQAWGHLRNPSLPYTDPSLLWCCQQLMARFTGEELSPLEPVPLPAQLRLGHVLSCGNAELALRLCQERVLTEEDQAALLSFYEKQVSISLLRENDLGQLLELQQQQAQLLTCALKQCPDLLEAPEIRFAVISVALSLPEADPQLQSWVDRMAAGPVEIRSLPFADTHFGRPVILPMLQWGTPKLDPEFFSRWDARLGSRLVPTLDAGTDLFIRALEPEDIRLILDRLRFTPFSSSGKLPRSAAELLLYAPEDLLPGMLQPGGLLEHVSGAVLLDACQALPISKRNLMLPLIRKEMDYAL